MGRPAKDNQGFYEWALVRHGKDEDGEATVTVEFDKAIQLPSVTTVIGDVLAKHALKNWAAKVTREGVAELFNAGETGSLDHQGAIYEALKKIGMTPDQVRDARAAEGTAVHEYLTDLARSDKPIEPSNLFETGIMDWWLSFKPEPTAVDEVVWSLEHAYCGTLDLEADVTPPDGGRTRYLIDLKTRKAGDKCLAYKGEHAQTGAYWLARGADPDVRTAVLVVNGSGEYGWHPGNPEKDAQAFLRMLDLYDWQKETR